MSEPRRPFRRGRRSRPSGNHPLSPESYGDADPYLEPVDPSTPTPDAAQIPDARDNMTSPALPSPAPSPSSAPDQNPPESSGGPSSESNSGPPAAPAANGSGNGGGQQQQQYNPQSGGGQHRD